MSKAEKLDDLNDRAQRASSEHNDQYLRHLVHKTILEVENVTPGDDTIAIRTNEGIYSFVTENDCCNKVWIEHLEGVELIIGKEVTDIIRKTTGVYESIDGGGVEEAILYTIVTTGGYLYIELRNNHNGYYSGKLTLESIKEK
jgi:hypothetical protein